MKPEKALKGCGWVNYTSFCVTILTIIGELFESLTVQSTQRPRASILSLWHLVRIEIPCNSTNPSPPFNPMTHLLDTSSVQASNLVLTVVSFQYPNLNFTKTLLSSLSLQPSFSLTLPSTSLFQPWLCLCQSLHHHACSLPLPLLRRHCFPHTQLRHTSKNKEKNSKLTIWDLDHHTLAPFLDPNQRE